MTQAVVVKDKDIAQLAESTEWTEDQLTLIKRTIAIGATNDELRLFLHQAKRTGLDPLSRQIFFVKRKDRGTIQTAIDGYRLIADRTGKYAGSDDYRFDEGISQYEHLKTERGWPMTATMTVWKMVDGVRSSFAATAEWSAYYPGDAQGWMWKKMPYLMLGKCAEALALRKAFPAELSGIYTNEEMQQADPGPIPTWREANRQAMQQMPAEAASAAPPGADVSASGAARSTETAPDAPFLTHAEADQALASEDQALRYAAELRRAAGQKSVLNECLKIMSADPVLTKTQKTELYKLYSQQMRAI